MCSSANCEFWALFKFKSWKRKLSWCVSTEWTDCTIGNFVNDNRLLTNLFWHWRDKHNQNRYWILKLNGKELSVGSSIANIFPFNFNTYFGNCCWIVSHNSSIDIIYWPTFHEGFKFWPFFSNKTSVSSTSSVSPFSSKTFAKVSEEQLCRSLTDGASEP